MINVNGVSITLGSPRQHVWTFAAANDILIDTRGHVACPCIHPSHSFEGVIPSFVGDHYYLKLAAEQNANGAITLMILSGMVKGVREGMSAVTEEDHGSVSSCLSQLKMILSSGCAKTV